MSEFEITSELVTESLVEYMYEGFRQHALETTGHDNDLTRYAFVANQGGKFAGAIVCHVIWKVLQIRQMFVEKPFRNQGLGSALMEKAIAEGKKRGCTVAFVETMSFQAMPFYLKMGFELEFSRPGFAHGALLHYLRKSL